MRLLGVIVAIVFAMTTIPIDDAAAQVWKPQSRTKARAKPPSEESKTRKASKAKKARTKSPKKKAAVKKKAKRAKAKAPARDDDDFTIIEEDYPDDE